LINFTRKKTKKIEVGSVAIGGDSPVSIQSMTNTFTEDINATVAQIKLLENAGCEIVRVAVPTAEAAEAIKEIKAKIKIPLIADIHFDYRLALASIANGVDALRINPGNIGSIKNVKAVVDAAKPNKIPIRIGVNSGSVDKDIIRKYGVTPQGLVESALQHVNILEKLNYDEMKISVKASSVPLTIESYRLLSEKVDYPLHLGVTESGTEYKGNIKSAIGIGTLLAEGIGDTIRVSLTENPVNEIRTAKEILKALHLRSGLELVSCPTCGRTQIDLINLAKKVEVELDKFSHLPITVAVMGCVVNGPGEAREADYGIAGGRGEGLLFKKGEILAKLPESELIISLIEMIKKDFNLS
jgi:(E)-4-hydroxy-3-methylbut-2-enyl-diphosphate synthase